jgi:hypothetical protein
MLYFALRVKAGKAQNCRFAKGGSLFVKAGILGFSSVFGTGLTGRQRGPQFAIAVTFFGSYMQLKHVAATL